MKFSSIVFVVLWMSTALHAMTREEAEAHIQAFAKQRTETLQVQRKQEMEAKHVKHDNLTMRYQFRTYGTAPEDGHSLYISMHGDGGAPARVNDQQWKNQVRLYQPDEGIYLAPRAATDTWNLWHQAHIDPMFDRIIDNFVAFHGVNPNRVYVLGYSAGGDGTYQIAPRMADRWAAERR